MKKLQYTIGNAASTTSSGAITGTDTSIGLTSDTNFNAKSGEGMVLIDEGLSTEELAYSESKTGSVLSIPLANRGLEGGTAQAHANSASVKGVISSAMWNNAIDALSLTVDATTGLLNKATGAEINTGTEDAKIVTPKAIADSTIGTGLSVTTNSLGIYNSSMARQAIINGNFDIWQRGTTSGTIPDAGAFLYLADRWFDYAADDGGTLPTTYRERVLPTVGTLFNSFYFSRLNTNGAGTSLGANSTALYGTRIEGGTRFLCGDTKKVTISFWARSSITNKKIGIYLSQCYGTGGSPSATEVLTGTNFTLTSTLTKYTYTFTTNTLSGKTFGTNIDDYIQINFSYVWGTSLASRVGAGTTAETYVGSGYIDIAQVQLCAGDVALPFMPKSFEEELRACQRYYQILGDTTDKLLYGGFAAAVDGGGNYRMYIPIKTTPMRIAPTETVYSDGDTANKATVGDSGIWGGGPANVDSNGAATCVLTADGSGFVSVIHNAVFHLCKFYIKLEAEL